jgi:hypothetical protein
MGDFEFRTVMLFSRVQIETKHVRKCSSGD